MSEAGDILPSGATRRESDLHQAGAEVLQTATEQRDAAQNEISAAYAAVFKLKPKNPVDPVAIVLADLRKEGFAERSTFVQGQPDRTTFQEGRRAMLVYIERRVRQGNEVLGGTR